MNKDKILRIIWRAIAAHFVLKDGNRLEADLKYEKNKSSAQVVAIGLCDIYDIPREDVETRLCIEPSSYDHKLKTFRDTLNFAVENDDIPENKEWLNIFFMSARYVLRRVYEGTKLFL